MRRIGRFIACSMILTGCLLWLGSLVGVLESDAESTASFTVYIQPGSTLDPESEIGRSVERLTEIGVVAATFAELVEVVSREDDAAVRAVVRSGAAVEVTATGSTEASAAERVTEAVSAAADIYLLHHQPMFDVVPDDLVTMHPGLSPLTFVKRVALIVVAASSFTAALALLPRRHEPATDAALATTIRAS